jgi:glutathione S-transferase
VATLYRCRTPTDWLCPCGRVARELRAAEIAHEQVRVPWRGRDRAEVEALSGQRRVPLLIIDGEAICDSKRIVEHVRWRATRGGSPTAAVARQASQRSPRR